jgi:hypothetical protein
MRRLLEAAKIPLLPFPHVTGVIASCQQEVTAGPNRSKKCRSNAGQALAKILVKTLVGG